MYWRFTLAILLVIFGSKLSAQYIPFAMWKSANAIPSSPTLIEQQTVAWNSATTPKNSPSMTVQAGDLLVAYAIAEHQDANLGISGGSLTWIERASIDATNYCEVRIWTAIVDSNKSMSVAFSNSGTSVYFGGKVLNFRSAANIGMTVTAVGSGTPSVGISTVDTNSAVVTAIGDWAAANGATRSWIHNETETSYFRDAARYTIYGGYKSNIGVAGNYTVGLSAPAGQQYAIAAIEIRGAGSLDPCLRPLPGPIGSLCDSGVYYAGTMNHARYMVTPGNCTNSSTPVCSNLSDTLTKKWIGTTGSNADISGLTNIDAAESKNSSLQDGSILTPIITADPSISANSAAHYCSSLNYGGYTDWYLPSKSELAFLYCHSNSSNHSSLFPQEDPNCIGYGGKSSILPSFDGIYAASTEKNEDYHWGLDFTTGGQFYYPKNTDLKVRCIRSYNDQFDFDFQDLAEVTVATLYEESVILSGVNGSQLASVAGGAAEIRVNSTGSWVTSGLTVGNGDTLNIRMYSSGLANTLASTTVTIGSTSADWKVTTAFSIGRYFVRVDAPPSTNLGGLSGANAYCLSMVQRNHWQGKNDADTKRQLFESNVKAWLCDNSSCQNFDPNALYTVADSLNPAVAGLSITATASGYLPDDGYAMSYLVGDPSLFWYMTGRGSTNLASGNSCSNWGGTAGNYQRGASDTGFYPEKLNKGTIACTSSTVMFCMINGDTP